MLRNKRRGHTLRRKAALLDSARDLGRGQAGTAAKRRTANVRCRRKRRDAAASNGWVPFHSVCYHEPALALAPALAACWPLSSGCSVTGCSVHGHWHLRSVRLPAHRHYLTCATISGPRADWRAHDTSVTLLTPRPSFPRLLISVYPATDQETSRQRNSAVFDMDLPAPLVGPLLPGSQARRHRYVRPPSTNARCRAARAVGGTSIVPGLCSRQVKLHKPRFPHRTDAATRFWSILLASRQDLEKVVLHAYSQCNTHRPRPMVFPNKPLSSAHVTRLLRRPRLECVGQRVALM